LGQMGFKSSPERGDGAPPPEKRKREYREEASYGAKGELPAKERGGRVVNAKTLLKMSCTVCLERLETVI